MAEFQTVIRGATVATAADVFKAEVGIAGGKIAALGSALGPAKHEIDARGLYLLPGGVDAHCHLDQLTSDGTVCADDFRSGTIAAAFGGTTTVIPFALQMRGQSLRAAVEDYHRRASGKAVVDYAFHLIVTDPTEQVLGQELPALIRDGYTSFKIYMTYDDLRLGDRQILDVLALARREGAMTMVHAENSEVIGWLTDRLEALGMTAPRHHATSRPSAVEREATHRAISLSEIVGVPILIVHVSGREAVEQIRWARARGLSIYAETCPQYLFLTEEDLARPGFEGAKCLCSPPPRDKANQEAIWQGLRDGLFDVFSSDHAPTRYDDPKGKMIRGTKASFRYVPNGVPGIETRLPLLFSAGVVEGRLDLPRFVALTAANPARLYGLYPRKGTVAVGSDADLVLWDPARTGTIANSRLHHAVDFTPYEGMAIKGAPVLVLSRGEVVCREGELVASAGRGRFLPCDHPEPAKRLRPPAVPLS
ncbi:MAG TPA: dihydropyrimidinase [Stellaceae bacterium]|nr:dihydropyrimidinase [Stellaceae bacterium]